jgi:formylglycine-generating enzyme required for sulfatase activity
MRLTAWRVVGYLATVLLAGGALGGAIVLALREHAGPARCPAGTRAFGARCCADGQSELRGRCTGRPLACPAGFLAVLEPEPGCVIALRRVRLAGGTLYLGPQDWQARSTESRTFRVPPFVLDSTEVTVHRWRGCVDARVCRTPAQGEPGQPVTGVSSAEAADFCGFAGGRLPRGDEWLLAAAGSEARRYPWGQTGLVCRRAAFGLVHGPCGSGATGPDWAGLRPDGATPERILDLAGNVAEWTTEPGGGCLVRGGSFRSEVAADLHSWAAEPSLQPAPHVGFRCAYDLGTITP